MKNKTALSLLLLALAFAPLAGADQPDQAKIKLPWDTLKGVLKLDNKEVRLTWEEFQALLKNTSVQKLPAFALSGGDVVLEREEFTRLINSLQPPPPAAPATYITKAIYQGRLGDKSVVITAAISFEVRQKPVKPLRIDLFPATAAFQDISLDGRPAVAEVENGRLYLTTDQPGLHVATLVFSLATPDADKRQSFSFPVARTPITEMRLTLPEKNLDVAVSPSLQTETQPLEGGTGVKAILSPTDWITTSWNAVAPEASKGPAKIYADVDHLLSIEDDALRVRSRLSFQILQNTINNVVLEIPKGFSVIDVQGDSLKEWRETPGQPATLTIPFVYARKGTFELTVTLEQVLAGEKVASSFTGLTVRGALRQKGFVGVELKTAAEVPAPEVKNLDRVDIQELPAPMVALCARPLLYGFKYLRPPFELAMSLSRHEDVSLVSSVIDLADGTTFLLPDGKRVHQFTYQLRNSSKQFLDVALPDQTRLWSAFVNGRPVKPSAGPKGHVLIPVTRSQTLNGDRQAFPVEIVYYEEKSAPGILGREIFQFPVPDVMVSRLTWAVHVPPDQDYGYFGRDLERKEAPRPWNTGMPQSLSTTEGFEAAGRPVEVRSHKGIGDRLKKILVGGKSQQQQWMETDVMQSEIALRQGADKEAPMPASAPTPLLAGKLEASPEEAEDLRDNQPAVRGMYHQRRMAEQGRGDADFPADDENKNFKRPGRTSSFRSETAGVLPIRVRVPLQGRVYEFTKTIPEMNSLLTLPLYHAAGSLTALIKLAAVIAVMALLYLYRRPLLSLLEKAQHRAQPLAEAAGPLASPAGFTIASGVLCLLASYVSPGLVILALLIYMAALARWLAALARVPQGE